MTKRAVAVWGSIFTRLINLSNEKLETGFQF